MDTKLKAVHSMFNNYKDDSELDFFALISDQNHNMMIAEYHVNEHSDDLAQAFTTMIEDSSNFAKFIAMAIGQTDNKTYNKMMDAIKVAHENKDNSEEDLTFDGYAEQTAHELVDGTLTFDELEEELNEVAADDYITKVKIDYLRSRIYHFYNKLLHETGK